MKEMKIIFLLYYSLNFISSTILNLNLHGHALMFIMCIKTSLLLKIQHFDDRQSLEIILVVIIYLVTPLRTDSMATPLFRNLSVTPLV